MVAQLLSADPESSKGDKYGFVGGTDATDPFPLRGVSHRELAALFGEEVVPPRSLVKRLPDTDFIVYSDHQRWHRRPVMITERAIRAHQVPLPGSYWRSAAHRSERPTTPRMFLEHLQRRVTRPAEEPPICLFGLAFPRALKAVAERVQESRAILELPADEESPGYGEATWERAARLIEGTAVPYFRSGGGVAPPPIISESDGGSIDVQWRTSTRNVLIGVPQAPDEPVEFYAHDRQNEGRDVRGKLDPASDNEWLLRWLLA